MLLRKLGELLRNNLRESDIKCRYGGDEFVIVLEDISLNGVHQRLDKIRTMVKEIEIHLGQEHIGGVSVSIGLVEAHECDWNAAKLLRAADESLYAAKKAGRDRIVIYPAVE